VSDPELLEALDSLASAATAAGLDPDAARAEGAAFAAAIAESAAGAAQEWAGLLSSTVAGFFDAAVGARRWRSAPTTTLAGLVEESSPHAEAYARALTEVAAASCGLGEPTMRVVANASVAAAAQLRAAGIALPSAASPTGAALPPIGAAAPSDGTAGGGRAVAAADAATAPAEAPAEEPAKTVEEWLAELDGLVGLTRVKSEVHRQAQLLRVEQLRAAAGLRSTTITRHLVFVGNPGTGKTTVARLVAGIYRAIGLLSKGQLVEVDRSELVAGYLGQTATKTAEKAATALGGVLFIDEAYGLVGDQYGDEAIDTLVKEMEDHRDDLVVIVAGYPAPMAGFIASNPGLSSRFRTVITFDDYSDDELVEIFQQLAAQGDYSPTDECVQRLRDLLALTPRDQGFGNGRFVRNLLEAAIGRHAWRLRDVESPTIEQLRELLPDDLEEDEVPAAPDAGGHR
jgi:adenylate kinase family enzyme